MIRILTYAGFVSLVAGIIVKDPPLKPSEYKYSYDIRDPTTGDSKSQQEEKYDGVVKGSYTVLDPDGTKRTVVYSADPRKGFNAVVRTEPAVNVHYSYPYPSSGSTYMDQQNRFVPQTHSIPVANYQQTSTSHQSNDLFTYPYHYYTKNDDSYDDDRHLFTTAQDLSAMRPEERFFSVNSHLFEPAQKYSYNS